MKEKTAYLIYYIAKTGFKIVIGVYESEEDALLETRGTNFAIERINFFPKKRQRKLKSDISFNIKDFLPAQISKEIKEN